MSEALAAVLADSRVVTARELRESHARRARAAQASYRRYSRAFAISGALATFAGALILIGIGGPGATLEGIDADAAARLADAREGGNTALLAIQDTLSGGWLRVALFVAQVGALAVTAYAAEMLRATRAGPGWIEDRQAAEAGRVEVHETIMTVAKEHGPEAEAAAFEHFVAEQLNKQLAYHEKAEQQHGRAAERSAMIGALVAALIAGTGATGIGGEFWVAIAALVGVIAPVGLNALREWQSRELDRERSEAYRRAWTALKRLSAKVDVARAAAAKSDPAPARALVAEVHEAMRDENEAWAQTKHAS